MDNRSLSVGSMVSWIFSIHIWLISYPPISHWQSSHIRISFPHLNKVILWRRLHPCLAAKLPTNRQLHAETNSNFSISLYISARVVKSCAGPERSYYNDTMQDLLLYLVWLHCGSGEDTIQRSGRHDCIHYLQHEVMTQCLQWQNAQLPWNTHHFKRWHFCKARVSTLLIYIPSS